MTAEKARDADVREWLMPFLLLCMRGGAPRGHELMAGVSDLGFDSVRPGEIYRTLRQAEEEGLIFSEREKLGYLLSRRRYVLTEPGEAYIEFLADSMRSYQNEIEAFLKAYEGPAIREVCG